MNRILALSPHSDDIELFLAFTTQREKPHVIILTESWLQTARGMSTQEERWQETINASEVLGYPLLNLGLRDDTVTKEELKKALEKYVPLFDTVYAPMLQHGNIVHDWANEVAHELWTNVIEYSTYTKTCLYTIGNKEVVPTPEELDLKNKALMCHKSQFQINKPHFDAVFGRSEWLNVPEEPLHQK